MGGGEADGVDFGEVHFDDGFAEGDGGGVEDEPRAVFEGECLGVPVVSVFDRGFLNEPCFTGAEGEVEAGFAEVFGLEAAVPIVVREVEGFFEGEAD